MSEIPTIHLKRGSAKPLHAGHPWVFADAVANISGPNPESGDEVRLLDDRGTFLGRGFFSPGSLIPLRIIVREDAPITTQVLSAKIDTAVRLRRETLKLGSTTTAYRLVNSEGDAFPGLIVDVYADYCVIQIGTAGMDRRINDLLHLLEEKLKPKGISDRSGAAARKLEKLPPPRTGALRGELPDEPFAVLEYGIEMLCDLRPGEAQKTGLFLDQRENRRRFADFAAGKNVLDVFSYSGGFSLHAAKSGAKSLTLIESSEDALQLAAKNLERNGINDADLINAEWTDAFRHIREKKSVFDLIVLDPPKFARARGNLGAALSAYRDLNAQATRLLAPGGILFTCSCSGTVPEVEFERAVASGVRAAGRSAALLERRNAGPDHPIPPGFEQGRYLKCLVLRVD